MSPYYKYHGFISYTSADSEAALKITQLSHGMGMRLWLDRDVGENDISPREENDPRGKKILGGDEMIERVLQNTMNSSMIIIVITSINTLPSVWVRKEIQFGIESNIPLFFWHIIGDEYSEKISIRRSGFRQSNIISSKEIENLSKYYHDEHLPSASSRKFMKELESRRAELNLVGHQVRPVNEIIDVFYEVNSLIELSELVLHNLKPITMGNLLSCWPEYLMLNNKAKALESKIESIYGVKISVTRVPIATYFSLKRPFVITRILHCERLLNDEIFRKVEFAKMSAK
jgi:hypothetical protein